MKIKNIKGKLIILAIGIVAIIFILISFSFQKKRISMLRNKSNVFLTSLKNNDNDKIYKEYGSPLGTDSLRLITELDSMFKQFGSLNKFDFYEYNISNWNYISKIGSIKLVYMCDFNKIGNVRYVMSYDSISDDKARLWGVDMHADNKAQSPKMSIRFLR